MLTKISDIIEKIFTKKSELEMTFFENQFRENLI